MKNKVIEEQWEYDNVVEFHKHSHEMEEQGMELVSHIVIAKYRRKDINGRT
jgi:hypothetical protein